MQIYDNISDCIGNNRGINTTSRGCGSGIPQNHRCHWPHCDNHRVSDTLFSSHQLTLANTFTVRDHHLSDSLYNVKDIVKMRSMLKIPNTLMKVIHPLAKSPWPLTTSMWKVTPFHHQGLICVWIRETITIWTVILIWIDTSSYWFSTKVQSGLISFPIKTRASPLALLKQHVTFTGRSGITTRE